MWIRPVLGVVTLAAAGALAWTNHLATPRDGAPRFAVTGIVVAPLEGGLLRVAHEDIPGYMPAMTMAFTLAEGETTRVAPGDRVRFTLRVDERGSRAEGMTVVGRASIEASTPRGELAAVTRVKRGHALPALALIDQQGRRLTRDDFLGHPTVMTFVFTRCPVPEFCPLVTNRFKALQSTLAEDRSLPAATQLLSVTIDPEFDTPAVLAAYARGIGAAPRRWRFAGGDPEAVRTLSRAFSVHVERNGALLDHTLATALIDRHGTIVEIWRGNGWKVSDVTEALHGVR
jgi:protein SCO1/2